MVTATAEKTTVATATPSSLLTTTTTTAKTITCCNCFGPLKNEWGDDDAISNQMSEVYCRTCDEDDHEVVHIPKNRFDSPAILTNVTNRTVQRNKSLHSTMAVKPQIHSKKEKTNNTILEDANKKVHKEIIENTKNSSEEFELGDDIVVSSDEIFDVFNSSASNVTSNMIESNETTRVVRGKEELPVSSEPIIQQLCHSSNKKSSNKKLVDNKTNEMNVKVQPSEKVICTHDHPLILHDNKVNANESDQTKPTLNNLMKNVNDNCKYNNNNNQQSMFSSSFEKHSFLKRMHRKYSTLPKMKKISTAHADAANCGPYSIPSRTVNGIQIYYMCDLSKNLIKGFQTIYFYAKS